MSQTSLKKERDPSILILDFGSQYSELIARRIRETNVFSLVVSNCISIEEIKNINPKGIILSGGPNSVYEQNSPKCDKKNFQFRNSYSWHMLWNAINGQRTWRICYFRNQKS
jgi:GMP synthase (glutamine-hydrolysing)